MAYKPKTIQGQYKRGDSGIATVKMSGDKKKIKVIFDETGKELKRLPQAGVAPGQRRAVMHTLLHQSRYLHQ